MSVPLSIAAKAFPPITEPAIRLYADRKLAQKRAALGGAPGKEITPGAAGLIGSAVLGAERSGGLWQGKTTMKKIWSMWALALVFATFVAPTETSADSLTFNVQSMSESQAQIEFYSQDRRYTWPGGNRAYGLTDYKVHEFKLNCINNEKICYGAWVTGNSNRYWGVGSKGSASCSGCCYTCRNNDTQKIVLRSPIRR